MEFPRGRDSVVRPEPSRPHPRARDQSERPMSDALAPIALFAYNRPRHLARTVTALLRDPLAAASDLHVFCDGAKSPPAEAAVREVRAFVRTITGFRSIAVVEQE